MENESARRPAPDATEPPFPAERAFVVQFRGQGDSGGDLFVGRAEHIASGAAERFACAADLIAFITKVLEAPRSVP